MRTTLKLFKLQIDEIYSIFKRQNIKKLLLSIVRYLVIMAIAILLVIFLAYRIVIMNFDINVYVIAIVLLATQCVALVFAIGNIISNLFQSSNNEILFTMPVSANQIFLSKIMVIYMKEVVVNSMYTLPLLFGIGIYCGFGVFFMLGIFPLMLLLPLLPLSIAALLSMPVMKLGKLLKKRPIVSISLITVAIIGFLILFVNFLTVVAKLDFGNNPVETVIQVDGIIKDIGSNTLIFYLLARGICFASQSYYILAYAAIGIALFVGAAFFIRPFFFKAAIDSREEDTGKTYKGSYKKMSPFKSLIKKEFLTGFRSPNYVFQYFIFALIMPVVVLLYDKLLLSMDIVTGTGKMLIACSHVLIMTLFSMLCNIVSASAITREGGNFYLVKVSPVNYYVQTGAKLVFNMIFSISALVLTCIISIIVCLTSPVSLSIGVILAATLASLFASLGHMCYSFNLDLKNPTLNWYDSGDVTTVSGNTSKSLITAVLFAVAMALIILMTKGTIWGWAVMIVICLVFCIWQAYMLILRVSYKYDRQEM